MPAISSAASKIVVVVGAGPGTGFAIAKRFAQAGHPVALISRSKTRLEELASDINQLQQGNAVAYGADVSQKDSIDAAFGQIDRDFGGKARVWGAVFNPAAISRAPFLETTVEQLEEQWQVMTKGGFLFAQAYLRTLTAHADWAKSREGDEPAGFLAVTGATASLKGSANFSAFASAKAGLRNITQSIAREYASQGVHVFHTIVDGMIDGERARSFMGSDFVPNSRFKPEDIAEAYYSVATQRKSCWTHELDMRPYSETW